MLYVKHQHHTHTKTPKLIIYFRDTKPVVRHPDFRLFACMNPATDVGKKDLPPGVRNRYWTTQWHI